MLTTVEVTAANQRGMLQRTYSLGFEMKRANVKKSSTLRGRGYLIDFPMTKRFNEAVKAHDMGWIELLEDDVDDD